jgi:hypothetical protein
MKKLTASILLLLIFTTTLVQGSGFFGGGGGGAAPEGTSVLSTGEPSGDVLTADGLGGASWLANGNGDVTGPASATDNAVARFDLTTGKLIQNSGATISDLGDLSVNAGTTALPGVSFVGDPDTGLMSLGANQLSLVTGGTQALQISATQRVLGVAGTVASPTYSFIGDPDTGIYNVPTNRIGLAVNGAQTLEIASGGLITTGGGANITLAPGANTGRVAVNGSVGSLLSGEVHAYGPTHATFPKEVHLRTDNLVRLIAKGAGDIVIGTSGTALSHTVHGDFSFGSTNASDAATLTRGSTTGEIAIQGDNTGTPSAVTVYGSSHASKARDIEMITSGSIRAAWDDSVGNLFVPSPGVIVAGPTDAWTGEGVLGSIHQALTPRVYSGSATNNAAVGVGAGVLDGANNRRILTWVDDLNSTAGLQVTASSGVPAFHIVTGATSALELSPAGKFRIGAVSGTELHDIYGSAVIQGAGNGLRIAEGANAKMGVSTLVAGTVVVATTAVAANSRIMLTCQDPNGGTPGAEYVSARTAATSFTITSTNVLDTCIVAWMIVDPS